MTLPDFQLSRSGPISQELYDHLREAIFDGSLPAGQRLVEESIAASANVSRTPVREALRKLEMEGLIVGGRTKSVVRQSRHELADLMTVREELEGLAARLAAYGRSDMEADILEGLHGEYIEAAGSGDLHAVTSVNDRFHETIWQASHNRYLADQLGYLRGMVQRLQTKPMLSYPDRLADSVDEHRSIVDAIVNRNADVADEAAKLHFRRSAAKRIATYER